MSVAMTARAIRTDRGLELAKDCLRKIIVGLPVRHMTREQGIDLGAAIAWICHKQAVEDRRRQRGAGR